MDNLTVTSSVPGSRWILQGLEKLVSWSRMSFKVKVPMLKKGKVVDKFCFTIFKTIIPTLSEKPLKSLGKLFDCSLKETAALHKTCCDLEAWLTKIDKSGLPGRFKAWIYQHAILPRDLWPLLLVNCGSSGEDQQLSAKVAWLAKELEPLRRVRGYTDKRIHAVQRTHGPQSSRSWHQDPHRQKMEC